MNEDTTTKPENANVNPSDDKRQALEKVYGEGKEGENEAKYALNDIQRINDALQLRERNSIVFNGIPYSRAYLYNQQKAINYSPPRDPKDDREVSAGTIHEKIIAFCAIFIKYRFKRRVKCYGEDGSLIQGLGDVYDLAIEFSQRMEQFVKKIALIYWEVFTQGNAFVLEDWEVKTLSIPDAYNGAEKVTADNMDYTYEFLENLTYKAGKDFQTRKAVSRLMDGRTVIFGNPEIEEVQDQPYIVLEEEIDRSIGEALYGTLKRWTGVPTERVQIESITPEKVTLFSQVRLAKPESSMLVHRIMDKVNNRFNIYLNGVMMLPRVTPFTLFYPRGNYPLTNIPAERLSGSIYARAIPAKTKFNADYVDWILKNLALKFEQGIIPAILAKGKYTLSRSIFRAGAVTHGVTKADYEKADPDNKGVTPAEFSFAAMIKDIVATQTLNPTASGELMPNATATEISITDQNQRDKLAYLLDGMSNGFMDMALRRAETIESKYTIKQKETVVDGKTISVYQNFNVNVAGVNNSVIFDDTLSDPMKDHGQMRNDLFKKAFQDKKEGKPSQYYIADPLKIRKGEHVLDIEMFPERVKDTDLQVQVLMNEITEFMNVFGANMNVDGWKKIYLEVSGRPSDVFQSADAMKIAQMQQTPPNPLAPAPNNQTMPAMNKGGKGKPAMMK